MKLSKASFENVMELKGTIRFPENKTVVIYGTNKAGKSNIIHALRYGFLAKVISSGKVSGYDELRLVTTEEMAPLSGDGILSVEFEHNGQHFKIFREINRYRDKSRITKEEAAEEQELDFKKTLDKELRAGLLNALFAPDSAMGFNHLNEKNIDQVIRELFKEVGNAKALTEKFKQRIEKLTEETSARLSDIQREYESFVVDLQSHLGDVPIDLSTLEKYDIGKTSDKIRETADTLKSYVDSIEKGELRQWLQGIARKRAEAAQDAAKLLDKSEEIKVCFESIERISEDREHLSGFIEGLKEVKLGSPIPPEPGKFHDSELSEHANHIYNKLSNAQSCYSNAVLLAKEENIDLQADNPATIRSDKEKVLQLLVSEAAIPDTPKVKADLVKIDGSVHGLIPLKLMDEDPAFTKLSPEPIPDASEEDKIRYAETQEKRIANLRAICDDKAKAESFFANEFGRELSDLSGYSETLMKNERNERETISNLVAEIRSKLLLLVGEDVQMPQLQRIEDLEPFVMNVRQTVSRKKSDYRQETNQRMKALAVEISDLLSKLTEMEGSIPSYKNVWSDLTKTQTSRWENTDAEYSDLTYVPAIAVGLNTALDVILDNIFDERDVIQGVREIITEINGKLEAEGLVNCCIEMSEDSIQLSKTTYKTREITHPCGAERSFFSLAALTALALYFRLPVIIDEAANNLDRDNLRRFISLVKEFAADYQVQYILSIKETDDFPLDGWVRQFADDLQIYRVDYDGDRKLIELVDLYT